jgi:hypothetical protein
MQDYRTLRFRDYLTPKLAPPPNSDDVLARVYAKLNQNDPTKLFPMDGNDTYGDCTIAGLAHAEKVFRGLIGKSKIMPATSVVKLYFQLSGGVDSGLNELDVLNYYEIIAFTSIDPKNHTHIQQAIHLFGGVYLSFQVQQNCQQ